MAFTYEIISLFVQSIMYGLYAATLLHCLRWLVVEDGGWSFRPWSKINWRMLAPTMLVFAFSTASIAISVLMNIALAEGEGSFALKLGVIRVRGAAAAAAVRPAISDRYHCMTGWVG